MSNAVITSENEVESFLNMIQNKLKYNCHDLHISLKQGANKAFLIEYALTKEDVRHIILSLKKTDFSEKMESIHPKFQNYLYLFAPYCDLVHKTGVKLKIQIYLKLVYMKTSNKVIVVSIHLPKSKLSYCF